MGSSCISAINYLHDFGQVTYLAFLKSSNHPATCILECVCAQVYIKVKVYFKSKILVLVKRFGNYGLTL